MKKIISALSTIALTLGLLFSVSACDMGVRVECEHMFNIWEEWEVTLEPTCTSDGERTRACPLVAACGTIQTEVIPAGHNFEWITAIPARCGYGEANAAWQVCTKCNAEGESWVGQVIEHEWEIVSGTEVCNNCGKTKESVIDTDISDFNDSFNGEYKLAEAMPSESEIYDCSIEGFLLVMGHGGYVLISGDALTQYNIGGFPDCLDEYAMVNFFTADPKYDIFGFSVGDSPVEAGNILIQRGYEIEEQDVTGTASYALRKIKVVLNWDCDGAAGGILGIRVILEVTNLEGIYF